jgi:hypothetical protein
MPVSRWQALEGITGSRIAARAAFFKVLRKRVATTAVSDGIDEVTAEPHSGVVFGRKIQLVLWDRRDIQASLH